MGLFSFVKNAGAKLFGPRKSAEETAANQQEQDAQKALELENLVRGLGLDVQDLYVEVNDDVASISGTTCCIEDKEKAILAIGNVEGISQVDDRITVTYPEPEESSDQAQAPQIEEAVSSFYTVIKGDTLSKIAKAQYGDAMKYPIIFEANRPMLKSPDLIYVGQVLRIPPVA